jgi:hypothetical protein
MFDDESEAGQVQVDKGPVQVAAAPAVATHTSRTVSDVLEQSFQVRLIGVRLNVDQWQ